MAHLATPVRTPMGGFLKLPLRYVRLFAYTSEKRNQNQGGRHFLALWSPLIPRRSRLGHEEPLGLGSAETSDTLGNKSKGTSFALL